MKSALWTLSFVVGLGLGALVNAGCGDECGGCANPPECGEPDDPCSCGCGTLMDTCAVEDGVHVIVRCNQQEACMERTACASDQACVVDNGAPRCSAAP